MRSCIKYSISTLLLVVFAPAFVFADVSYFSWNLTGVDTYTATLNGVNATLAYSTTAADTAGPTSQTATDSTFISTYGTEIDVFGMSNGVAGSSAHGMTEIVFDVALPENAILIAFDLDTIRMDEFQFSNTQNPLGLLEQLETEAGANSSFPLWNAATQSLISSGVQGNANEATVFDVGGNMTIDISFFRNAGGSSIGAGSFAIGVAIPEPNGFAIALVMLTFLGTKRTQRHSLRSM